MSEKEFVRWLQQVVAGSADDPVPLGDDAAVLRWDDGQQMVVTTDLLADGVHFQLAQTGAERIGRKALAVNLSDLAAMAAEPVGAVVSLLLPRDRPEQLARQLLAGMKPLADEFTMRIVGGDTNCWDGPLVINVAAFGKCSPGAALRRDRARPGDRILVTGKLGGSRLGKQFDFVPRVREARQLMRDFRISAGMDISDGLLLDLSRMATASRCGAVVDLEAVPISNDAERWAAAAGMGKSAREHACSDGEDFELLLGVDATTADRLLTDQPLDIQLTCVGEFIAEEGLWQKVPEGKVPLACAGYDHLALD